MGCVDFTGFLNASNSGRAVVDAIERLAEPAEYTDRDDIARVCAGCRQAAGRLQAGCRQAAGRLQATILR